MSKDVLFGYPHVFLEAERRWNFHVLKTQGIIKPGFSQARIDKILDKHQTGDYNSILGALSKIQVVVGAYVNFTTNEPTTWTYGTVLTKHPFTVFLNTNNPNWNLRKSLYHELVHAMQFWGGVERKPLPNGKVDYDISDEFAEGKILFKDLGTEQQAEVIEEFFDGSLKLPKIKAFS
ncbi:MAG: hypothetical protein ACR2O0_08495 [Rhizobiaceae bacterium]